MFRATLTKSTPLRARTLGRSYATAESTFAKERDAVKHHAHETSDLWRKISFYVCIPALSIAGVNAYNLYAAHQEHVAHHKAEHPDEDLPEYSYQNIRTKNFCWGDGDKTLFWNDAVNRHKDA